MRLKMKKSYEEIFSQGFIDGDAVFHNGVFTIGHFFSLYDSDSHIQFKWVPQAIFPTEHHPLQQGSAISTSLQSVVVDHGDGQDVRSQGENSSPARCARPVVIESGSMILKPRHQRRTPSNITQRHGAGVPLHCSHHCLRCQKHLGKSQHLS